MQRPSHSKPQGTYSKVSKEDTTEQEVEDVQEEISLDLEEEKKLRVELEC
jgi:hypothetical protein